MDEEYERAKCKDPTVRKAVRELLEYGESRDGYWNSDKFMKHMKKAVQIASFLKMRVIDSTGSLIIVHVIPHMQTIALTQAR